MLAVTAGRCSRIVVYDTADNFGNGERYNRLPGARFLVLDALKDLCDYLCEHKRPSPVRVVYKPDVGSPATCPRCEKKASGPLCLQHDFDAVCAVIFAARDTVLCVDEIQEFCSPNYISAALARILLRGRVRGVTLLWATQSPATVSRRLTGMSTEMRVFRLADATDLKSPALQSRLSDDARAQVARLPDRFFVQSFMDGSPWRVATSDKGGNISVRNL